MAGTVKYPFYLCIFKDKDDHDPDENLIDRLLGPPVEDQVLKIESQVIRIGQDQMTPL